MILPATHKTSLMGSGSSLLRDYEPETYRSSVYQHDELEEMLTNLRNYAHTMINHLDR